MLTKKFEKKNPIMLLPLNNLKKREAILNKYHKFVFISPHLDDAILSCGNLIYELKKRDKKIFIITVFTRASRIESPQAKKYLNQCLYTNAQKIFKDREKEDLNVCNSLDIIPIHMGFIDAAWRHYNRKPVYHSNDRQYSGEISYKDKDMIKKITDKLKKIIDNNNKILLLSPLGIGNHIDHLIVNKIVGKIKIDKIFWEDFPYSTKGNNLKKLLCLYKKYYLLFKIDNSNFSKKLKLIKLYKSQFKLLFVNGVVPEVNERFYKSLNK